MQAACRAAQDKVENILEGESPDQFVPIDKLKKFLTPGKIEEILYCDCSKCKADKQLYSGVSELKDYVVRITGPPNQTASTHSTKRFYSIFGLLIYSRHPLFIIGFLDHSINDGRLEAWALTKHDPSRAQQPVFSRTQLKQYTGEFCIQRDEDFDAFVKLFLNRIRHFAIPQLSDEGFWINEKAILPFIGEKEIGKRKNSDGRSTREGANGRVFAFKIYHEYDFINNRSKTGYVRKQIQTLQPQAFLERSNIEYVQRFEDDHIVKLVKAYAHGENINLVFPKAWTNLDHLLRDNEYHYDSKRGSSLSAADAWIQLQGISSALKRMHGFGSEESGHSERMTGSKICIHFDLKPDNILVEEGLNGAAGRWLITDFGQAALAPRGNGTTPLVGGHFGTDAYAPPEIDESVDTGRAYDIWSLGCIMLEIAAFVLYSYAGLKGAQGLDQARRSTQPGSRGTDERFFYRERGKQAVVKKAIYDFMVQLQTDHAESGESDPASKEFLSSILCIIQDMLRPQAKDRINMERVVDSLVSALAQAKADPTGHDEQPLQESQNETILGGAQLRKITLWRWLGPGKGNRLSNLEVSEDNSGVMRLHCWAKGLSPVSPSFHRADIKIIPLYAFWDPDGPVKSRTWLNFLRHSEPYSVSVVADTKYAFDKLQDARHVQSTVTSQEILDSFDLTNFKFQTPQSLRKVLKGFKGIWSKQKAIENVESTTVDGDSLDLGSATIQIWVETPPILDKPVVSVSRKNTLYQSDSELSKVPPRRVCIYLHKQKFVFTIKVDDNWVVGTSSHDTGNSRSGEATQMFFEPHPKRNPSFYGSWLRPTPAEHSDEERYPAGIPLDPKVLQYYEDMDSVEIESVELTFANSDGCKTFHEKYLDTKERWSKERSEQHDRIQVNREPETRPRLPEGVNRLPFPAKKVPFRKTNVDRDSQSSSRLSTAGSMHDSTMEHVAPQQETRFLTVGHSHNHRRRRASNEYDA